MPHSLLRAPSKFGCSEVRWSHLAAWPITSASCRRVGRYWFALTGQMIDAETAFRLGSGAKDLRTGQALDDCVELATTINRNGRLIAEHTMEFIEDKLLYDIQGWEKAFEIHREFYAHLRSSKDYDEGSGAFPKAQTGIQPGILRRENQVYRECLLRLNSYRSIMPIQTA